jgi:hypothetical protein
MKPVFIGQGTLLLMPWHHIRDYSPNSSKPLLIRLIPTMVSRKYNIDYSLGVWLSSVPEEDGFILSLVFTGSAEASRICISAETTFSPPTIPCGLDRTIYLAVPAFSKQKLADSPGLMSAC